MCHGHLTSIDRSVGRSKADVVLSSKRVGGPDGIEGVKKKDHVPKVIELHEIFLHVNIRQHVERPRG